MSDLPDGVYLGLHHDIYFTQDRMGSSDWIGLDQFGLGWWWKSKFNRHRQEPKTKKALLYGSALHVIILEGVSAYEREFAVEPHRGDFPKLVETIDEMKEALADEGFDVVTGKSGWKKERWADEVRDNLHGRPCWPNIMKEFLAEIGERKLVSAAEDFELRFLREMATSEDRTDNIEVRRLLATTEEHPALAEVSVFATVDGTRRRWRFDRLYPGLTMDLKSLAAWSGRPLTWEAGDVLAKRRWSIQRADYAIGRREAFRLVYEGKVFGGALEERRYLERLVADNSFDAPWLWCVYEKPDSIRGVAPTFMPIWDEHDSDLHKAGAAKLAKAIRLYKMAMAEFGPHEPWGKIEALHYTSERYGPGGVTLPRIFIPPYAFETVPMTAEAYEDAE